MDIFLFLDIICDLACKNGNFNKLQVHIFLFSEYMFQFRKRLREGPVCFSFNFEFPRTKLVVSRVYLVRFRPELIGTSRVVMIICRQNLRVKGLINPSVNNGKTFQTVPC